MKRIILIASLFMSLGLVSCDGMGPKVNSSYCTTKMDVKMDDGTLMWVYKGKIHDGYLKGSDENGQTVYLSMNHILTIIVIDCNND